MKKILLLILFASMAHLGLGQVSDDFSDGNFTTNPIWSGDIGSWSVVDPESTGDGSNSNIIDTNVLASNGGINDAVLTTASNTSTGEWVFSVATGDGWSTSDGNNFSVIFMTDDNTVANLTNGSYNFNGYFLQFGNNSTPDNFKLFKQTGTTGEELLDTSFPGGSTPSAINGYTVKITRGASGTFEIFIDEGFDNTNPTTSRGSFTDNTHNSSAHFALSTNIANSSDRRRLYFDNLAISSNSTPDPVTVTLTVDNSTINEDEGSATITATLNRVSGDDITLSGFTTTGSASAADFTFSAIANPSQLTITAGQTSTSITVTAINDALNEGDETVVATITATTPAIVIGTPNSVTITIEDDDVLVTENLFISEVADPQDEFNARFVEFYNAGETAIDFSAETWYLVRQANGNPTSYDSLRLTGSIDPKKTFVFASDSTVFNASYGFNPNMDNSATNNVVTGNGDDAYFLYKDGGNATGTLVDIYGVANEDGTSKDWEYLDGRAERVMSVTSPNTTWTAPEWAITRPATTADMTPGSHNESPAVVSLFISEVADPQDEFNARFVEFYNAGETAIDFSTETWYLVRQANGNPTSYDSLRLTGSIDPKKTFVFASDSTVFNASYGFNPNMDNSATNNVVTGNGDDAYFLYKDGGNATGTLVDIYGVANEDGTGKDWEYLDGRAERVMSVTSPNTTWTAPEWAITRPATTADMTPGSHNESPAVVSLFISEVADPQDEFNARFVEFYNAGETAIDFSAETWYLVRQANGNPTSYDSLRLTGSIDPKKTFVFASDSTVFNASYGFNPNMDNSATNNVVTGNGDDAYFLYKDGGNATGTLVDIYGVANEDGTGKDWEYLDGRAERVMSVTSPNTTWTAPEWAITRPATTADMTPGSHNEVVSIKVSLSVGNTIVNEDAGTIDITATLTSDTTSDVTVNLAYSGTATNPTDYTGDVTIVIPVGSTTGTATISIVDDSDEEMNETIGVKISSAEVEIGTPDSVGIIIRDNDTPIIPAVSIATIRAINAINSDSTISEDVFIEGVVTSSNNINGNNLVIQDNTAGIVLRFAASETQSRGDSIRVNLNGGRVNRFNELLQVSGLDESVSIQKFGTGSIPAYQTITISELKNNLELYESELVSISNARFGGADGSETISGGEDVIVGMDTLASFVFNSADVANIVMPRGFGTVSGIASTFNGVQISIQVASDVFADFLPTITLAIAEETISEESGTATVTATLSAATTIDVVVNLSFAGTANSSDYSVLANAITIAAGSASGTTTITAIADGIEESAETIIVSISSVENGTEDGNQSETVTIEASSAVDLTPPAVAILGTPTSTTGLAPSTITFEFSENVTGFTLGDITLGNATAINFTVVDGRNYTADITPTANGTVTINVNADVATDGAGNGNTAATQTSFEVDASGPTATITTTEVDGTENMSIVYTVTFSEAIAYSSVSFSDFVVTGGGASVTAVDSTSATVYEVTVTVTDFGNSIALTLPANSVEDLAGNGNLATSSSTLVTDLEADLAKFGVNIFSKESAIFLQFADAKSAKSEIAVYDLSGKVVFQAINNEIQHVEINSTQSGIFIVRMQNEAGILTRRVLVE